MVEYDCIGRPGWCRSIRCAVARRQICSMPVCRAGEPSRTKRADDGIHLVSYTVIDRLLFTSRPWANDVVMNERALGEKGCSRRFSHGSQGPAHARTGHALGQHSTGRLSGGRFPRTPFARPQPEWATACTHSINVLIDARAALVRIADGLEVPVPKRLDAWLQRAPCQARFVARKCRSVARAMRCWRSVQEGRAGLTIRGRRTR